MLIQIGPPPGSWRRLEGSRSRRRGSIFKRRYKLQSIWKMLIQIEPRVGKTDATLVSFQRAIVIFFHPKGSVNPLNCQILIWLSTWWIPISRHLKTIHNVIYPGKFSINGFLQHESFLLNRVCCYSWWCQLVECTNFFFFSRYWNGQGSATSYLIIVRGCRHGEKDGGENATAY